MVWAAVTVRRLEVGGHNDLNFFRIGTIRRGIEIVNFEPEQDSMSVRPGLGISDRAIMVPHILSVELENQLA
jgi:hypothetical protein